MKKLNHLIATGQFAILLAATASAQDAAPKSRPAEHAVAGAAVNHRAALAVGTAIKNLGPQATPKQVSNIVYAAIRQNPDAVLEIVHVAVIAAPASAAPEIVASAIRAVPNPLKEVIYQRIGKGPVSAGKEPDFKEVSDFKETRDSKESVGPGVSMTLAEAILQAALDARAGLDARGLMLAAEIALATSVTELASTVNSPRGIAGVGDAGNANFANEPLLPPLAPKPVTPKPEPVSP
jgi:hypothetical protein